jgi:hypothetical protein
MRLSDDGSTWTAWEPYVTIKPWTLPSGDGAKTVYVEYRDQAGNVSAPGDDMIVLDTVAPVGTIVIDGGELYAGITEVELTLSADDETSGISQMRFSDDDATWTAWEPYETIKPWTLPAGDGVKTVYVQYADLAGNVSPTYNDTIILDTTAPVGAITINDGDPYTFVVSVTLSLSAGDTGTGVTEMRLSDDGSTWGDWETYVTSKPWTLSDGDGVKAAYVVYRDQAGRSTDVYSDTIVLDTLAPTSSAASPTSSQQTSFVVTWSGTDVLSGIASYDVQYRAGRDGVWTLWLSATSDTSAVFGPNAPVAIVRGQTYFFQVRAADRAGNVEAYPAGDGDTSTYVEEMHTLYLPLVIRTGIAEGRD